MTAWAWIPIGFTVLALAFLLFAIDAFRQRRMGSGSFQLVVGAFFLALAAVGGLIAVGSAGYQALTRETVAATATVQPQGDGAHVVSLRFPDGSTDTFVIRGDELYIDAQILKWHPAANVVGLHTGYALDRIAGRYRELADEQTQPRTVHSLHDAGFVDLFDMVRRYPFLAPWVDATYGSGTFAPIGNGGTFEIRVSTSGLLIRTLDTQ